MSQLDSAFDDDHAAQYDQQFAALRGVKDALHLALDLAFRALPDEARVLHVGAGTGQELLALAADHPGWSFVAVDPSAAMLEQCRIKAEARGVLDRCTLHVGTLDTLPADMPFHAATAILVSHFFMDQAKRTRFHADIRARLAPGGTYVAADLSAEDGPEAQDTMLALWRSALGRAMAPERVNDILEAYGRDVALSSCAEVQDMLRAAGFINPFCAYQFGMIRAWVAQR